MYRQDKSDERGALNLIDAEATLRGIKSVCSGNVLPLAIPIVGGDHGPAAAIRAAPQHFMTRDGGDYAAGLPERGFGFADDVLFLSSHGTTHLDALSHVWQNGRMYNGFSAAAVTSRGASRCGIDKVGAIATRALFLDLEGQCAGDAGHAITPAQLADAAASTGVEPQPGDALVIRTGWLKAWREGRADDKKSAGLHHDCASWIVGRGFSLVAADNIGVEVMPSRDPACVVPLHIRLMRDHGVYFAELLDLEALATAGRATFMLVIAPLNIAGGVGSPVTPVAIL